MSGKTILVVEDDSMVLMGLSMVLESWGMIVLAADDLPQVDSRLGSGPRPDAILSDLNLRDGVTGFQVVEHVRDLLGEAVPALILTGDTGRSELEEGQRRHLAFLHKPVQPDALRRAVAEAVGRAA